MNGRAATGCVLCLLFLGVAVIAVAVPVPSEAGMMLSLETSNVQTTSTEAGVLLLAVRGDLCDFDLDWVVSELMLGYLALFADADSDSPTDEWFLRLDPVSGAWGLRFVGPTGAALRLQASRTTVAETGETCLSIRYCDCCVDLLAPYFEYVDSAALQSEIVEEAWYDGEQEYLVLNLNGTRYHYCSVPRFIWEGLQAAPSKGTYYNEEIKGQYDCRENPLPDYALPILRVQVEGGNLNLSIGWNGYVVMGNVAWDDLLNTLL